MLWAQFLQRWQEEWPVTQNFLLRSQLYVSKISPIKTQTLCLLVAALMNRLPWIYAGIMGLRDVCSLSVLKQQSVHLSRPTCQAICSQSLRQSAAPLGTKRPHRANGRASECEAAANACARGLRHMAGGQRGGTVVFPSSFTSQTGTSPGFPFFFF